MIKFLLGATVGLGVIALPASAQETNAMSSSSAPAAHKTMTATHTVHSTKHMTMTHRAMSRHRMSTMKWCQSMSHKRAMRYNTCRALIMRHHGATRHHAITTTHTKPM